MDFAKRLCLFFFLVVWSLRAGAQQGGRIDSISNLSVPVVQQNLHALLPVLRQNVADAQRTDNVRAEAKTCGLLALALYFNGDYDENIVFATRAINLFEQLGDRENMAKEYSELGYRLKATNIADAEKYLLKAMRLAEEGSYIRPLLSIYNQYGEVKSLLGQADSALHYFFKGLAEKQKANDSIGIPYSLVNIGYAYAKQKKFDRAKKYFDLAMQYRQALNDPYGIADSYAYYGDLYFEMKAYARAAFFYEKSIALAEKHRFTNLLRHDFQQVTEAYEKAGDLANALRYHKKNAVLKDSIVNQESYKKMAELQMQFDVSKKENQLLEQEALARKRTYIIRLLALAIASLGLIGAILYRSLLQKAKAQKKEFELQAAIEKVDRQNQLHEQKLSISRDLHDNIGAQLTFIISAIETLKATFRIPDEAINRKLYSISAFARDTMGELRDTVWAMNQSQIRFEEMYARMMNFIEKARASHDAVDIRFEMAPGLESLSFSSFVGVNIYRILQEAVHNALKYAGAGTIEIRATATPNGLEIAVADNGKGFEQATITPGNGLHNMKKRAQTIGGTFSVQSEQGSGTVVLLAIPQSRA